MSMVFGRNLSHSEQASPWKTVDQHTSQMMSFQMINAGEASLTDGAAKVLLGGLHGGPSGRREPGVIRKKINFWGKKRVTGVGTSVRYWYYTLFKETTCSLAVYSVLYGNIHDITTLQTK